MKHGGKEVVNGGGREMNRERGGKGGQKRKERESEMEKERGRKSEGGKKEERTEWGRGGGRE